VQASLTEGALLEAAGWGGWAGCDATVACEVVEHVHDTDAFARCLLGALRCVARLCARLFCGHDMRVAPEALCCYQARADVERFWPAVARVSVRNTRLPHALVVIRCSQSKAPCRPRVAVVSTPNMEYNEVIRFALPHGDADPRKPVGADGRPMRDIDHKFEWTRAQFAAWAERQAATWGYSVATGGVGVADAEAAWRERGGGGDRDVGNATQARPA
jgi:hypothetical protein